MIKAPTDLPTPLIELMTRSMHLSPQAWRDSCDLMAELAEEQAATLHDLAKATSPLVACAVLSQHWQETTRKSLAHLGRLMQPAQG